MIFRLDNVSVEYSGMPALDKISFNYDGIGVVMLTGATGAGKTTLLRLLYADILPTAGSVLIDGMLTNNMKPRSRRELRRKLGIVQQDCRLVSDYTSFENVLMPYALRGFSRGESNKLALELFADLGISYIRQKMPRQLSGGERHLVALARALAMNPSVILADEPTGTLDERTASAVAGILHTAISRGVGLIASTHSRSFAVAFPQAKCYVLEEGKLRMESVVNDLSSDVGFHKPDAAI